MSRSVIVKRGQLVMNGKNSQIFKSSSLAAAVAVAINAGVVPDAKAAVYEFSIFGIFTMLASNGAYTVNNDLAACMEPAEDLDSIPNNYSGGCNRTGVLAGTMIFDTVARTGTMTIAPFSFFGGGAATATSIDLNANSIGSGIGGPGTLVLGNMGFDWNGTLGIPVSTVWDASGLFGSSCLGKGGGLQLGDTCSGTGAIPASSDGDGAFDGGAILAMTIHNTTSTPGATLGSNPSGTLPLITDTTGFGGDPMITAPFSGQNANFDFLKLNVIAIDGQGLNGPPVVSSRVPAPGATQVNFATSITVLFDRPVNAQTVAAAGGFTLKDPSGNDVPGVVTPTTGSSTQFTFKPNDVNNELDSNGIPFSGLNFLTAYTVTLDSTIASAVGNMQTMPADVSWTFTTGDRPVAQACSGQTAAYVSAGSDSNFTMLDAKGSIIGGANDVTYSLDFINGLNDSETGVNGMKGIATNTLASGTIFFGQPWVAHHIRLFGPGDYEINVDCTLAQLEGGTCAPSAFASRNMKFTVGANQVAAHILFDWNNNNNIDVVNVWNKNDIFDVSPDGPKNDLYTGPRTGSRTAGDEPDPQGTWLYASTDVEPDGVRGIRMVPASDGFPQDSPFSGSSANFNLGPQSTCTPAPPPVTSAPVNSLSKGFFGCTLTDGKVNPWQRADLGLLAGFLGVLAFWRRRNRTNV
jgi:hypothetical protein